MIGILKDLADGYALVCVLMTAILACCAAEPLLLLGVAVYCRIRGIKV